MPTYAYRCACGAAKQVFYPQLPSEARQKAAPCDVCEGSADRDYAAEGFFAIGGQHGGIEKAVGMAAEHDASGRPIFRDGSGKVHEIRTSRDLDSFTRHNAVGPPEMEWRKNAETGETEAVPVVRNGQIVRKPEKLTPLDGGNEWAPPAEAPTGRPIRNGAIVHGKTPTPTGEDVWGGREGGEPEVKDVGVRRPPDGTKWR